MSECNFGNPDFLTTDQRSSDADAGVGLGELSRLSSCLFGMAQIVHVLQLGASGGAEKLFIFKQTETPQGEPAIVRINRWQFDQPDTEHVSPSEVLLRPKDLTDRVHLPALGSRVKNLKDGRCKVVMHADDFLADWKRKFRHNEGSVFLEGERGHSCPLVSESRPSSHSTPDKRCPWPPGILNLLLMDA